MHVRGMTEILMAVNMFRDTVKLLEHGVLYVHIDYSAQYFFSPYWEFRPVCKWHIVALLSLLTDGNFHEASATYTYHIQVHSHYM